MNIQKPPKGIEWTRVKVFIDDAGHEYEEMPGATWNVVAGCKHGCEWPTGAFVRDDNGIVVRDKKGRPIPEMTECYAKTLAERGVAKKFYPEGFAHHYFHEHRLDEPLKVKKQHGIFSDSMSDLFAKNVPEHDRLRVIGKMYEAYWHIFMVLTKYPSGMKLYGFPWNCWAGFSIPSGASADREKGERGLWRYLTDMAEVKATVRFFSAEPLWFDAHDVIERWMAYMDRPMPFEWVLIGAASKGRRNYQPHRDWTKKLLDLCDYHGIPVFFKGNMEWDPADWRADFPTIHGYTCEDCGKKAERNFGVHQICQECAGLIGDKRREPEVIHIRGRANA